MTSALARLIRTVRITLGEIFLLGVAAAILAACYRHPREVAWMSDPIAGSPVRRPLQGTYSEYGIFRTVLSVGIHPSNTAQGRFRLDWAELALEVLCIASITLLMLAVFRLLSFSMKLRRELRYVDSLIDKAPMVNSDKSCMDTHAKQSL